MNHIYKVVFRRGLGCFQAVSELASGAPKSARRARRSAGALAVVAAVGLSPALAATFDLPTSAGTDGAVDSGQSGTAAYGPVATDNDIYNLDVANSLTGGDGAKGTPSASGVAGNGGNGGVGIEVDGSNNTFNFDGDVTGGAAGGGGQGLWGSSVGGFPGTAANAIQVDGAANDFNITGNVTGGRGGDGGFGGTSRNGGNGAAAIGVNGTGNTITVDGGTLTGGDGGNRGNSSGSGTLGGTGGVAVQLNGTDNRLITNGTLNGGNPGVGSSAVANAVQVSGSGNTVELRDGYSFGGDVVVQSGSHTLALGGATGAGFDASLLVSSQPAADGVTQFVGFANLEKTGAGTWTVTGTRADNGTTTISEGTLIGSAAALGNGNILNNGSLEMSQTVAGTYSGNMSGTGDFTKTGAETLTLTGTNSHTGGTTISAGTLAIGDGGTTGSISGDITNNGTLQFNRSDAVSFAGVISGTGGLTQAGNGMLTLTGTSTYSGATTVDAGTLVVNGSIANSIVDVNDGATLMGAGTIGGLSLNSGATLATGNSIDTLTVDGDVVFEAGSIFEVEVEADGSTDVLAATGTATINGGTVDVQASDVGTWSATTDFSILTADGGVTGEFDTVTSNLAFLTPTLSYDANSVQLTLTRNDISFDERARIAPEKAVARALQRIYSRDSSALGGFFPQFLALSVDDAERALETLNGNSLTTLSRTLSLGQSGLALQHVSRLTFGSQLLAQKDTQPIYLVSNDDSVTAAAVEAAEARRADRPKQGIWIEASGAKGDADSSNENYGSESETKAVSIGFDVTLPNNMIGGVALSRLSTDTEFDTVNDDQELDQTYLTLYLQQQRDKLRLNGLIAIGSSDIKTQREIEVGSTRLTAKGDTEGSELYGYAEAGYDMGSGALTWQPVVGLSVADIQVDEFFETGAGDLNLWVEEQKRSSVQSRLGGRLLHKPAGSPFATEFYAFWAHEFADLNNAVSVQFSEAPGTFYTVRDGDRERDALEWGASSLYNISDRATLTARVGGMQSSNESWLSGSLGVQIHW